MNNSPLIIPKSSTSKIDQQKMNIGSFLLSQKTQSKLISNITRSTKLNPVYSKNRQISQIIKEQNQNLKQQNEFLLKMLREFDQKQKQFEQKQQFLLEIIQQIKHSNIIIEHQIMNKCIEAEKLIVKVQNKFDQLSQVYNNINSKRKKVTGNQLKTLKTEFFIFDKYSDGISTDGHEMLSPKSIGFVNEVQNRRQKYQ